MPEVLGKVTGNCAGNNRIRTRVGDCDVMPTKLVGLLLTPKGATFPADADAFLAELEQNIVSGKIIPLTGLEIPTVSGFDIASSTPDGGGMRYIGLNPPQFDIPITGAGLCKAKALVPLNLKYMSYIWLCQEGADYRLFAATKLDADGNEVIYGYDGQNILAYTMPTGTEPFITRFNVSFSTLFGDQFASTTSFVVPNTTLLDGLMGITLAVGTVAGTATIVSSCSGQNVGADIAAMLDGDAVEMFENTETGANPTTATIDPTTGLVTIAPAGTYRIVPAAALFELGVVGFDGLEDGTAITSAA